MAQGFDLRHLAICAGSSRVLFCLRSLLPLALLLLPPLALPLLLSLLPPLLLLSPLLLPLCPSAAPALPPRCVLLLLLPRLPAVSFCCSRSFSYCLFLAWRLAKKDGFGDKRMRSRRLVVKLVAFGE